MGKTWKRYPINFLRNPRGHIQARRAGCRASKVPPDSWEDIQAGRHCYAPSRVARKMAKQGISAADAILKLKRKFKLSHADASKVVQRNYRRWNIAG